MAMRLDSLRARRILAGLSQQELAQQANVSVKTIVLLESPGFNGQNVGGSCDGDTALRILNVLAGPEALTSNSQANPTVFTTTTTHTYQTGDTVVIAGVTGANADPNGTRVVTRINSTQFSVPVNCTTAGGTGGTATASLASLGVAVL